MVKILTLVGARPQFIKAAPVTRALQQRGVDQVLVHSGQHYDQDLSGCFFEELGLPEPDHHLHVGSAPHGVQTAAILAALEPVIIKERPDWVLVYGDTNTTLAGALAAAKLPVKLAHVEAGIRSGDRTMPEELNRILTDHVADLLLAPSSDAVRNLAAEGVPADRVRLVGDVMYDAALTVPDGPRPAEAYALATLHRAENTDDPVRFNALLDGLARVAGRIPVIMPLHPRTRKALARVGREDFGAMPGVRLSPPLGYARMIGLERGASLILTDSGGVQKEAFFARVPCVTLRDSTEWPELIRSGWNRLLPAFTADAVDRAAREAAPGRELGDLFGGGRASQRVVAALCDLI